MTETERDYSPPGPTLLVSSTDLELGRVGLESDVARHVCLGCDAELDDRYHFDCPECGRPGTPRSSCRSCGAALSHELIRYVAVGASGGSVTKLIAGVSCPSCGISAIEDHALDALAA